MLEKSERPWGRYEVLQEAANYKVKSIHVFPGKRLSYQRHQKRSEHWYITQGSGEVTLEGKTVTTPGVVTVLRDGSDKVIRTTVDGCDSATPITKKVTPVFFGNIIIGGLLGSTTDNATGKMWDYEDSVEVYCAS